MNNIQDIADELMLNAAMAAGEFQQLDQSSTDKIVENIFKAGLNNRVKLARLAQEETGIGVWQHKVLKNVLATQMVFENIKDEKTVGVIKKDDNSGIVEIAQPLGPVFAIIPITNPTSTILFKILISMKTRNPVIVSPPRNAVNCCKETVDICYEAALAAGAPEDCIQIIEHGSRELTRTIMSHPHLALTLATGGTGLVHAAYSSGNPAIGVGPGNVPVFIDKSADIPFAIENIITSKTFDNGTVCASEQSIIVEKAISDTVRKEFEKQQCYFIDEMEIKKLEDYAVLKEKGTMNPEIVGKPAGFIAEKAGINIPEGTKILMARLNGVGTEYPLSIEILAPVLAYYECENYEAAIKTCIDLNFLGGIGHTAAIYANDEGRIMEFSRLMNAGRIVVNTPSSQGAVGGLFNTLYTSFTLGCGTGGKNITTENISAHHLINIQRVCRRKKNVQWFQFDLTKYTDENIDADNILNEYYKNY
ncbi:MAG: aldehyde dehydrogenase family protein [Bacteroidetes bacterium]|nr:aldehyde dehydrogenase family protein [Bacteroidota bacterium]MBL7104105.1 aldehyde dehydrogenase family protein [Bacteroidales bacterium]